MKKCYYWYAWLMIFGGLLANGTIKAQTTHSVKTGYYQNPIIPGFAPDPSICRAGEDYYLINSTFEYFPAIPIYHSRDLVNWELIGHALSEVEKFEIDTINSSAGIHAPTIRYHDSTFYVVVTHMINGKAQNLYVTAKDPRGPWSAPVILESAVGIDPSLFFDDDGKVWYTANRIPEDPEFDGQAEIWLQELDLKKGKLVGERYSLWRNTCIGGVWAEGPHIYKKNGYYYLLTAEGGTLHNHAVMIMASKDIRGPYINNERNPILTHRHLSYDYPIIAIGHADMVETPEGQWHMVALGFRPIKGKFKNLGRETYLIPVRWEKEPFWWKEEPMQWPACSPWTGRVELEFPLPYEDQPQMANWDFRDEFDQKQLALDWNFRRSPEQPFVDMKTRKGHLRMALQPSSLGEQQRYSFMGVRQRHFQAEMVSQIEFNPKQEGEEAGIMVIQNDRSSYRMTLSTGPDGLVLQLIQNYHGKDARFAIEPYDGKKIYLKVVADYLDLDFYFSKDGTNWESLVQDIDGSAISPESSGWTYTGVYMGLYASSNGLETDNYMDVDWFEYSASEAQDQAWFTDAFERIGRPDVPFMTVTQIDQAEETAMAVNAEVLEAPMVDEATLSTPEIASIESQVLVEKTPIQAVVEIKDAPPLVSIPDPPRPKTMPKQAFQEYAGDSIYLFEQFPSVHIPARDVEIYLPKNFSVNKRYPVIYAFDGQHIFREREGMGGMVDEWRLDEVLDSLQQKGLTAEAIVVGIWNGEEMRRNEYMPEKPVSMVQKRIAAIEDSALLTFKEQPLLSDETLRFLVNELKPFVDNSFPTRRDQANTYVFGASMGGLMAAYAICEYPTIFGGAACFSTHWPALEGVFLEYFQQNIPDPSTHQFYFDHGTEQLDALYEPYQNRVDRILMESGYELGKSWITVVEPGAEHNEKAWSERIHIPLRWFLSE